MQYKIYCPSLVSTAVPVPNIDGCTVCRALASHIQRSVALRADQAIVTVALRQDRPQLVRAAIPVPNIDDAAVRGVLAGIVRKVELTVLRFVIVPKGVELDARAVVGISYRWPVLQLAIRRNKILL